MTGNWKLQRGKWKVILDRILHSNVLIEETFPSEDAHYRDSLKNYNAFY